MRRSRISVRPNLGPKGGRGTSTPGGGGEEKKSDPKTKTKDVEQQKTIEKPVPLPKTPVGRTKKVDNEPKVVVEKTTVSVKEDNDAVSKEVTPSVPDTVSEENGPIAAVKNDVDKVVDEKPSEGKEINADGDAKKTDKSSVKRRSRFPKARPNLSDAGRPRTRNPSVSVSDTEEETKRHPPSVHRTAPLRVSQGQAIPSTPPVVDVNDDPVEESKREILVIEEKPSEPASTLTSVKPMQEKQAKKGMEDAPAPVAKKEVKKRYKVNWGDDPPDRTKMTMRDLIHWNPSRNPMKNTDSKKKKVLPAPKDNILQATEEEQQIDDAADTVSLSGKSDQVDEDMPVPQVMIGPDGKIILNEKSLVIESTPPKLIESSDNDVVHEDETTTTYASFRNRTLTKTWTQKETTKFYTALSAVGTDFSLIHQLFPKRTRTEIKNKYKKEERVNKYLIDKALRERRHFDMSMFENRSESDDEVEVKKKTKKSGRKRKNSVNEKENPPKKTGKKKAKKRKRNLDESDDDGTSDAASIDDNLSIADSASVADDVGVDSDEENEVIDSVLQPTRYGRQPKKVEDTMYLPAKELASRLRSRSASISSETSERSIHDMTPGRPGAQTPTRVVQIPNNLVNMNEVSQLSPGKVMILTNREIVGEGENAKEVVHVYLVSPNQQTPGMPLPPGLAMPGPNPRMPGPAMSGHSSRSPGFQIPHQNPRLPGFSIPGQNPGLAGFHVTSPSPWLRGPAVANQSPRIPVCDQNTKSPVAIPTSPMQFRPIPMSAHQFRVPQGVPTNQGLIRRDLSMQAVQMAMPPVNQNISHVPLTISASSSSRTSEQNVPVLSAPPPSQDTEGTLEMFKSGSGHASLTHDSAASMPAASQSTSPKEIQVPYTVTRSTPEPVYNVTISLRDAEFLKMCKAVSSSSGTKHDSAKDTVAKAEILLDSPSTTESDTTKTGESSAVERMESSVMKGTEFESISIERTESTSIESMESTCTSVGSMESSSRESMGSTSTGIGSIKSTSEGVD